MDNIYRCRKLAAAKRVAVTKNVTISYINKEDDRTKSTARKTKWRRSLGKRGDGHDPNGMLQNFIT